MSKLKIGIYSAIMALCLIVPVNAKTSAKDLAEKNIRELGKGTENFNYDCEGNDAKASCTIKKLIIDQHSYISNIKLAYTIDNKNYDTALSFDIHVADPNIDASMLEMLPKHVNCISPTNTQGSIYKAQITCDIVSPVYTLQLKSAGSMESQKFKNQDIEDIISELENIITEDTHDALKDFKIDPREFAIQIKAAKMGDKLFNAIKKQDSTYTKEQYNAAINMGVAMVPVGLADAQVSEATMNQVTKAVTALGDIATSKKQQATITLKRKSGVMLELADLPQLLKKIDNDPLSLLKYLDEYQISVVAR